MTTPSLKRPTEAFRTDIMFEEGIGTIYISRFKGGGMVEIGVFLVDMYCLGVKDAYFQQQFYTEYDHSFTARMQEQGIKQPIAPACARKLIEGAVAYAQRCGIPPHPDYKKACRVLGGIKAEDCPENFVYGKDGKPFYLQGPNDSAQRAHWVMDQLDRFCGEGNYHFLLVSDVIPEDYFK